jgi:hypothetical protein
MMPYPIPPTNAEYRTTCVAEVKVSVSFELSLASSFRLEGFGKPTFTTGVGVMIAICPGVDAYLVETRRDIRFVEILWMLK